MAFGDITPWIGLGPLGYALFWLLRDNIRLRSEAKHKDERIEAERKARFAAEAKAAAFEAAVAGLERRVEDLTDEVQRLRTVVESEGSGHA